MYIIADLTRETDKGVSHPYHRVGISSNCFYWYQVCKAIVECSLSILPPSPEIHCMDVSLAPLNLLAMSKSHQSVVVISVLLVPNDLRNCKSLQKKKHNKYNVITQSIVKFLFVEIKYDRVLAVQVGEPFPLVKSMVHCWDSVIRCFTSIGVA